MNKVCTPLQPSALKNGLCKAYVDALVEALFFSVSLKIEGRSLQLKSRASSAPKPRTTRDALSPSYLTLPCESTSLYL